MAQRKMVKERDDTISGIYDFENTLEELCLMFANLKERFGPTARVCVDWHYDDCDVYLEYERPETDEEMNKRLAKAAKRKLAVTKQKLTKAQQKEAADRKLYEQLKEKFEGK